MSVDQHTSSSSSHSSSHSGNYQRPTFFRQTRKRGKILKTVEERYVRQDLGLGSYIDHHRHTTMSTKSRVVASAGQCVTVESTEQLMQLLHPNAPVVICDTNVLLHNWDVIEAASTINSSAGGNSDKNDDGLVALPNLVIPQTALQECRNRQFAAYNRVLQFIKMGTNSRRLVIFFADLHHVDTSVCTNAHESSNRSSKNDQNDARIQQVAELYAQHLDGVNRSNPVVLLTDDRAFRDKVNGTRQQQQRTEKKDVKDAEDDYDTESSIQAMSVRQLVRKLEERHPTLRLLDRVAQHGGLDQREHHDGNTNSVFSPYLDSKTLEHGIKSEKFHRGVFRSERNSTTQAYVTIRKGDERVAVSIIGSQHRNRAVDGDVVAIALNPLDQWIGVSSFAASVPRVKKKEDSFSKTKADKVSAGIAVETAEPTHGQLNNVTETVTLDQQSLKPTGRVLGVLRRNFTNYCGSVLDITSTADTEKQSLIRIHQREHADGSATCVFFPVDTKIHPILIRTTQLDRLKGQRLEVSMDSWPVHSALPLGHYVRTIGSAGSKDVETEVLLQQHKIAHEPFSAAVLACLPPSDYRMTAEGRKDLRGLPVLSIDPPGCKDIDDALHCIVLENGNWQIGVHIADVTHYVKAGSAIDLEAANRSTSTYLVNKRLDMLPSLLTTDLCSLKGNVDRYAFSVLWEVTPQADILNVEFTKSIIHSIAALTYQQAQTLIDNPDEGDPIQSGAVNRLAKCARIFRKRRLEAGALTLASPEVKFVLDSESLNPTDVQSYSLLEANAVVEEFMLLANVTVAKKILRHYPTLSVLRRHPAPNRSMFDSLISKARSRGFELDIEDSKRLADSLDAATIESDPYFNKLLRVLSTRCMSPAQYFCSGEFSPTEWHHYGLAAPVYTHFTSPIRRYADVCVHRLLAAAIGVAPLPVHLSSKTYLHDLAANMNRRHRAAQLAGRASVNLHTLIFFAGKDNAKEEDAYVLDVSADSTTEGADKVPMFTVLVPRYGIEGQVRLGHLSTDSPKLKCFPNKHMMSYKEKDDIATTAASIQVFDKVRVRIWVRQLENHQRELILDLLAPNFGQQSMTTSTTGDMGKTPSSKRKLGKQNDGSSGKKRTKTQ